MPTRSKTQYIVRLEAEGTILSQFLTNIRIVNSMRNCWPVIDLTFFMDNQEIIEKDLYSHKEFNLKVWLTAENGEPLSPPNEFKLIYFESNLDLPAKREDNMGKKFTDY